MQDDYFHTNDLGLTASLTASGFPLAGIDKSNPKRVVFYFEPSQKLTKAIEDYWSNKLLLPAAVLLEQIRLLKARIYG